MTRVLDSMHLIEFASKVKAADFNEPSLKSAEINVETFKGATSVKNDMRVKNRQYANPTD